MPFWLSAVVVLVAFFIRRKLDETPEFEEAKAAGTIARMPLKPLLRNHWRDVMRVFFCAFIAAVSTVFANLAIAYGKKVGPGRRRSRCGWSSSPTSCALGTQPMFGKLADRIGRKPVFIYGALSSAVLMPFYLLSMSGGNDTADVRAGRRHLRVRLRARPTPSGRRSTARCSPPRSGSPGVAIGTQLGFLVAGFAPQSSPRSAGYGRAAGS